MRIVVNDFLEKKKALIAFNVQNIYQLNALYFAAKKNDTPVIAQFSAKYIPYFHESFDLFRLIQKYQCDFCYFHLDHCLNPKLIEQCIDAGFASVMFDGSSLPLHENINITNKMYQYAAKHNSMLEAELGAITGIEDGVGIETGNYYSIQELDTFSKSAQFDLLALGIGNAHGVYSSTEGIKIEKLLEAQKVLGLTPLVLHGGTGMPDEMVRQAIEYGVVKINVSTALKIEYNKLLSEYSNKSKTYDEFKFSQFITERLVPFYETYILKFSI
ncbi:class II fructose-bisphosphate aldolase [Mucilaginibacter boryungensis]|uniref:fructose-bisphosphate aldolase n=1 Tax=Mucilaginibacter boryungensis TaxID=768480 RepID=A0ABR9XKJ5_9SPHI|nr:class II fructose-bisphosphate aldolase [Mucilaginibacter boryungensis]MBE9667893.1 class II fructose-bisphosphate aldolase [Mucilaginibacter boryungensis]